jgi:DnaK suppressor protein
MNVDHFRKLLQMKQHDLLLEIAELKEEAQRPDGPDVGDWADQGTLEVETNDDVGEAAVLTETLAEVRRALQRIKDGTYGKCIVCGRQIKLERLEAVPWTHDCLRHESEREGHAPVKTRSA